MTEVINTTTGEIATVDPSSEVAVTSYLQQARDWLATAVETTGPEQIARAKAEIATAAEATKQLHLSKEIQDDAQEMVRRAEYALGKSIRRGQAAGSIAKRGDNREGLNGHNGSSSPRLPSPTEYASRPELNGSGEYPGIYALADVEDHEFEEAITEAREEGNLSRANVVRKLKPQRATRRAPLTDFAFDASVDLLKVAERISRITADDRFDDNRDAIKQRAAGQINRAMELLGAAQTAINSEATP